MADSENPAAFDAEVARIWELNREGRAEEALTAARALVAARGLPALTRVTGRSAGPLDLAYSIATILAERFTTDATPDPRAV